MWNNCAQVGRQVHLSGSTICRDSAACSGETGTCQKKLWVFTFYGFRGRWKQKLARPGFNSANFWFRPHQWGFSTFAPSFAVNYRKIGARRQVSILGWFVNMSSGHSCNIVHRDISLNQVKYIKFGSHQMVQTFEIKKYGCVESISCNGWLSAKQNTLKYSTGSFYFARMFLLRRRKDTRARN